MALVFNEEQRMLRDMAREFFSEKAPVSNFREVRSQPVEMRYSQALWQEMKDLGWAATAVPEELGGSGFGVTGCGIIAMEAARTLAATPFLSTAALGVCALTECKPSDARDSLLSAVAEGGRTLSLAFNERLHFTPDAVDTVIETSGNDYRISGHKRFVADGASADVLLVLGNAGAQGQIEHYRLCVVEAGSAGIATTPLAVMDSTQYAHLQFTDAVVLGEHCLEWSDSGSLNYVHDVATVLNACELFGCSKEAFSRTVEYLKDRSQFGKKIGSFQALQHRAAHLYTQLELLKSVLLDALSAADEKRKDLSLAASHVKALANDVARLATNEAIQMHGGIGITDELDIGLFYKRARTLQAQLGSSSWHRARFARLSGY